MSVNDVPEGYYTKLGYWNHLKELKSKHDLAMTDNDFEKAYWYACAVVIVQKLGRLVPTRYWILERLE